MTDKTMVPTLRLRGKSSDTLMVRKKERNTDKKRGANEVYSDDDEFEDINLSSCASTEKTSIAQGEVVPQPEMKKGREVSFALPPAHPEAQNDTEEVEQELDLFSKAIHISNIDEIDHVGLMRGMHERFQRKQVKWQNYASAYSKWAFAINFVILIMQIVQMLFHQLVEIFNSDSTTTQEHDSGSKFSIPRVGLYRRYGIPVPEITSTFTAIVFNASSLQALRCVLAALTAIAAGLQMKLKLTEKAEKYRRGAKVYARLHRISTYYLMLAENGGKVEDVTGLWREAMKKEGKWIPVVKTFMAT